MNLNVLYKFAFNICFFFLIPFNIVVSQSNWFWQNPFPTGNSLTAIDNIGDGAFIIVGDMGTVLTTSDNGLNWQVQTCAGNLEVKLNAVSFANSSIGIAVGDSGKIIKTTDGGIHWIQKNSGTVEMLLGVDMIDPSTCVVVGANGTFLLSFDVGENWTNHLVTTQWLTGVAFANRKVGIIIGSNSLLMQTTNGGESWSSLSVTTYGLSAIKFIDSTTAIVVGGSYNANPQTFRNEGIILRTTNSGFSWSVNGPLSTGALSCISFASEKVGVTAGIHISGILKTTDGGITWSPLPLPNGLSSITGITISDLTNGICVQGTTISGTTNGGLTWQSRSKDDINTSTQLYAVSFSTPFNGYAVGGNVIASTSDGGTTWIPSVCGNNTFVSVSAINENTAFAVGNESTFKTTDGGLTWEQLMTGLIGWSGVSFSDANNGTIVGGGGTIYRTTDGGTSWNPQTSGTKVMIWDVSQVSPEIAWAVGDGGLILRTTNGGVMWSKQLSNTNNQIFKISTLDANNAFALAYYSDYPIFYSLLLHTTNGGTNWDSLIIPSATHSTNLVATDTRTVIVVGYEGTILRTTDAGGSWVLLPSGTHNDLYGVSFANPNVGTIVGLVGTILHTTNGGVLIVKDKPETNLPNEVLLYQNYPNPFNPTTTISFSIPSKSFVSLKVFDLIGREITTVVSEEMPAGSHSREWNATKMSSGLYFYRLQVGSFTETKKLILLK